MAEIVLLAVIRKAVEIAGNLLIKEGSRLSKVKEDINWIESEMRYIQSYLEDADSKQDGDAAVAALVNDIRSLCLDLEDIMDKYFPQINYATLVPTKRLFGFGYLNCATANVSVNFVSEIEGIRRRVAEINRRRTTYGIQEKIGSTSTEGNYTRDARRSYPHIDEPNVVGFRKHIERLVGQMLDMDSNCPIISITGMAGLGKTTLAKKVYNSVVQSFECSAWICVSQQPNISDLLRDIARQVGLEKQKWDHDVQGLQANLFEFLRNKRYAIVIDDIWETESWNALKIGIPNVVDNGCRIILTSRNRDVVLQIGGQSSLHELQPLNLKKSRKLFSKIVSDPLELENVTEQILKRCGGVPLAIVLTAGMLLLRERSENAWKGVLESMGQEEDQCSKIFALSYKDLPTKLKPCFLYFGLFPQDYEIPASDLVKFWAAEGFIRGSGMREVEKVGEDYLNHLIARNLIQVARRKFDGRINSFRIHDLLHSLCIRVAKEINFLNTYSDINTANYAMGMHRLATHSISLGDCTSFNNFRTPKLRAMICFDGEDMSELKRKHIKSFLGDLRLLRVLSLECGYLDISLPNEFGYLSSLIYLRLKVQDGGSVKLPSTISNLRSLLILDARECNLNIPDCIYKMKQLHVLKSKCFQIKYNLMGLLLNMVNFHTIDAASLNVHTLYGLWVPRSPAKFWYPSFTRLRKLGVFFEDGDLSNVKVLLDATTISHKLETLRLESDIYNIKRYDIVDLNLSRYENLLRLHLLGPMVELAEHANLPPNLTKLTLKYTKFRKDPMENLKKLPKLTVLKLDFQSYVGERLMVCQGTEGPDNFPQLQVLEIQKLSYLKEFLVEEGVMPQLKQLRITSCCPVTRIPDRISNIMVTN